MNLRDFIPPAIFHALGSLYKQASPGHEQVQRSLVTQDNKKSVTPADWKALLSYSRSLFATLPPVTGAVLQKASYAIGDAWVPQYQGADKAWGDMAEEWLWQWMKVADVRGEPYDFRTGLYLDSLALDYDGDNLCLLTSSGGWPAVQRWPAHRIGSGSWDSVVPDGQFKGRAMYNGVIFDDFGRAIAFRLLDDRGNFQQDVSAFNSQLLYEPDWQDQGRGLPRLAAGVLDWFDLQDIREGLNAGVKLQAFQGLKHTTEGGRQGVGKSYLVGGAANAGNAGTDVQLEKIEKGLIWKFKAGKGEDIEPFTTSHPSPNIPAYMEHIMRGAFAALEWPIEMSDPTKIGGAATRLLVGMVRRTVAKRQTAIKKRADRLRNYAIGYAIKNKIIAPNSEWWKFDWQMPQDVTVDEGRDEKADLESMKMGVQTMREYCGRRNQDWLEERAQAAAEANDLCARAAALAKQYASEGLTFKEALQMLRQTTPNLPAEPQPQQQGPSNA